MNRWGKKFRSISLGWAAAILQVAKSCADRLTGRKFAGLPNYTLMEPGLYLGGACEQPPPDTKAVLRVTPVPDQYTAETYEAQPILDVAPSIEWLERQVRFVDRSRSRGLTTFVHCDAGADRSAMVMVAFFMWRDRIGRDNAIEHVQRKRACVKISPVFLDLLARWEAQVARCDYTPTVSARWL
jgi:hypothetical protein